MANSKILLLMILGCIALYPDLISGFYLDDSFNVSTRQALQMQGLSLWDAVRNSTLHWIVQDGRLFPFSSLTLVIYYYFSTPLAYHSAILFFVILSLISFYHWLRSVGTDLHQSTFIVGIVLCLFQVRDYHDPITSYACLLPISALLGFSSSTLFHHFLKQGRTWRLLLSQILLLCAFLTYEVNLVFIFLHLSSALQMSSSKNIVQTAFRRNPFCRSPYFGNAFRRNSFFTNAFFPIAVTSTYLIATLSLRWIRPPSYAGISLAFNLRAIKTYLFQISAALPLTYPVFGRSGFFKLPVLIDAFYSFQTFVVYSLTTFIFYRLLSPNLKTAPLKIRTGLPNSIRLPALGLFLIPATLIAITSKYQDEITRPGNGYLPVYLSYFGSAVLIGAYVLKKLTKNRLFLISCTLGTIATLTFTTNLIAVTAMNHFWKYPREMIENAMDLDVLQPKLVNRELINITDQYWFTHDYLAMYAHLNVPMIDWSNHFGTPPGRKTAFNFASLSKNLGWIVLAPVTQFQNQKYSTSGPIQVLLYSKNQPPESSEPARSTNETIILRISPSFEVPLLSLKWKAIAPNWFYTEITAETEDVYAWRTQPLLYQR